MMSVQRLGSSAQFDETYLEHLIEWKGKYPASFSEVWLATSYGFPSLEKHRDNAKRLGDIAKRLRAAGIRVSLQVSNTIGHGQYMSSEDCGGLVYAGSPVRKMVGHDGTRADYCFCWRGEHFRRYVREELAAYAEAIQPDTVWIDDDFRADNHAPVEFGCFCEDCMRTFNQSAGTDFTREALVREILHGDIAVRKRFVAFLREELSAFMAEMCKTMREVSPKTTFGLQNTSHSYTDSNWRCAFEAMRPYSYREPCYRSGGGVYNDHNPNDLFEKVDMAAVQNAMLPEYVTERVPEIENLPFTAFGKSPAGTALEAALNLANGHTGLTFSMMMRYEEPPTFYERFLKLLDGMGEYFERLSEVSAMSRGGGLRYVLPEHDYLKRLAPDEDLRALNTLSCTGARKLLRDGIAVTYEPHCGDTRLLCGDTVRALSDDEIERVLAGRTLMDGEAAARLKERGFDLGLDPQPIGGSGHIGLFERFTDDPLNRGGWQNRFQESFVAHGASLPYAFRARPDGARVLGGYGRSSILDTDDAEINRERGDCTVIVDTPQGGRAAVFGYALLTGNVSSTQRDRVLRVADALGERPLPARMISADQAFLYPRLEKHGEKTLAVSVANATVGAEGLTLGIRNPAGERFVWMAQYGATRELSFEKRDGEYVLALPELAAYSVGTVFCIQ